MIHPGRPLPSRERLHSGGATRFVAWFESSRTASSTSPEGQQGNEVQRQLALILRHLRRVVVRRTDGGLSDAQLQERSARQRDEAASELQVWRDGPMVLGVARRMLGNLHDALCRDHKCTHNHLVCRS